MSIRPFIFLVIILCSCFSCDIADRQSRGNGEDYYNIEGLVAQQILKLDSMRPSLLKSATVAGVPETNSYVPDSLGWAKEFELLLQADLNRSSKRGSYFSTTGEGKEGIIRTYQSLDTEITMVDTVKITFEASSTHPVTIQAYFSNKNNLYKTSKEIEYQFIKVNNSWFLSEYSVKGWQRMVSEDTSSYRVFSKVQLNQ